MTECMPISAPPLNHVLSARPGTSGIAVGPELSIRDTQGTEVAHGVIGNICIRGTPKFNGYEDPSQTAEAMFPGGWFNTGDAGYLDDDGYLYITGRSKEVINRGGELISPVEVEDAIKTSVPSIDSVAAISVAHDLFQEVVGVVVSVKAGSARPSLANLQDALSDTLHPSKWPQVVVYMDAGLPMTSTNKVQRVNLVSSFYHLYQ